MERKRGIFLLLRSVTYFKKHDILLVCRVYNEIESLRKYFYSFCKFHTDECMENTFFNAVENYAPDKGDLRSYIKSLAQTSYKFLKRNTKEVSVDFLDDTVDSSRSLDDVGVSSTSSIVSTKDFSNKVVKEQVSESFVREAIIKDLMLPFLEDFLAFGKAIKHTDTTRYNNYNEIFKKITFKFHREYSNFIPVFIKLYEEYKDNIHEFLYNDIGKWKAMNTVAINKNRLSSIRFTNPRGDIVHDPDLEDYSICGSLNRPIYKVRYWDLWDRVCKDLEATTTNMFKLVVGDYYVLKTLSGCISVVNANISNFYDIVRDEILTTLLDKGVKLVNIGSENFYITSSMDRGMLEQLMEQKGLNLELLLC